MVPGSVTTGNMDLVAITGPGRSQAWTDRAHGNKLLPDYSVIFPDETLHVVTSEQKGHIRLNSTWSFTSSLDPLIWHVNSRYAAFDQFLTGVQGSQLNRGA